MAELTDTSPRRRPALIASAAGVLLIASAGAAWYWTSPRSEQPDGSRQSRETPAPPVKDTIVLKEITEAAGLRFEHVVARPDGYYAPDIMSAGLAVFDFDQDGRLDIYLLNGSRLFPHGTQEADAEGAEPYRNRLFRQQPDGTFNDVTERSGLGDTGYASGVAVGDVNNDGWPDVYLTNLGEDRLFLNQRDGTFLDVTEAAGIDNPRWGASASFVDIDRDGWLDLYVTNYVDLHASRRCVNRHGAEDYCHPNQYAPTSDKLYRNATAALPDDGAGVRPPRFEDVSLSSGIAAQPGPGLGVLCADFNEDGWADIYVANDSAPNFLWINQRDGTFRDEAVLWGVATDGQGQPQSSMGIVYGDVDGDGRSDLLMTHFSGEPHTLYRRLPGAAFTDWTVTSGFLAESFHATGFGIVFCDLDHNGHLDALVANGHVKRPEGSVRPAQASGVSQSQGQSASRFGVEYAEPNHIFLNDGSGRFRVVASDSCPFRSAVEVSRGLASGDLDGDGALDFVVSNAGGPARVYLNRTPDRGHWLLVRAVDPALGGRDAYGAVVTVHAGGRSRQHVINANFSYLSASDPRAHFGLGDLDQVERIDVLWPDGLHEAFPGTPADRALVLARGEGDAL